MNVNQIAFELYGKYMSDLNPYQQDIVWSEYERRIKP